MGPTSIGGAQYDSPVRLWGPNPTPGWSQGWVTPATLREFGRFPVLVRIFINTNILTFVQHKLNSATPDFGQFKVNLALFSANRNPVVAESRFTNGPLPEHSPTSRMIEPIRLYLDQIEEPDFLKSSYRPIPSRRSAPCSSIPYAAGSPSDS